MDINKHLMWEESTLYSTLPVPFRTEQQGSLQNYTFNMLKMLWNSRIPNVAKGLKDIDFQRLGEFCWILQELYSVQKNLDLTVILNV